MHTDPVDEMIAAANEGVPVHVYRERVARRARRAAVNAEMIAATHRAFAHTIEPDDEPTNDEEEVG